MGTLRNIGKAFLPFAVIAGGMALLEGRELLNPYWVQIFQLACVVATKACLERCRPVIHRLVVVVRQLINHVSLVGALHGTTAAAEMTGAFRGMLGVEDSANSFAFGSYAASLECQMPGSWSSASDEG